MKYKVFVNGQEEGTIETNNISEFIEQNYSSIKSYKVSEENKMVHIYVSLLDLMKDGLKQIEEWGRLYE